MGEHNADFAFRQCGKLVEGKNLCAKRGECSGGNAGEACSSDYPRVESGGRVFRSGTQPDLQTSRAGTELRSYRNTSVTGISRVVWKSD